MCSSISPPIPSNLSSCVCIFRKLTVTKPSVYHHVQLLIPVNLISSIRIFCVFISPIILFKVVRCGITFLGGKLHHWFLMVRSSLSAPELQIQSLLKPIAAENQLKVLKVLFSTLFLLKRSALLYVFTYVNYLLLLLLYFISKMINMILVDCVFSFWKQ